MIHGHETCKVFQSKYEFPFPLFFASPLFFNKNHIFSALSPPPPKKGRKINKFEKNISDIGSARLRLLVYRSATKTPLSKKSDSSVAFRANL